MLCAVTGSHHLCHVMPNFTPCTNRRQEAANHAAGQPLGATIRVDGGSGGDRRPAGRHRRQGGGKQPLVAAARQQGADHFPHRCIGHLANAHSDVATYHCREVRSREWLRWKLVRYHEQCALCHTSGVSLQGSAKGDAALEAADRARAARDPSVQRAHDRLANRCLHYHLLMMLEDVSSTRRVHQNVLLPQHHTDMFGVHIKLRMVSSQDRAGPGRPRSGCGQR